MKYDPPVCLGVPPPAGSTALYAERTGGSLLLGLAITDRTLVEIMRVTTHVSSQVTPTQTGVASRVLLAASGSVASREVTLTTIAADDTALARIGGILTWSKTLPPGGRADLRYRY